MDALAFLDKTVDNVEGMDVSWRNDEVLEMLRGLREQIVANPDQAAQLSVELAEVRAELEEERAAELFMTVLYASAIRHVEGERDRARALAVRLEQELALVQVGVGKRRGGRWAL